MSSSIVMSSLVLTWAAVATEAFSYRYMGARGTRKNAASGQK
jgi:hypothetical protein